MMQAPLAWQEHRLPRIREQWALPRQKRPHARETLRTPGHGSDSWKKHARSGAAWYQVQQFISSAAHSKMDTSMSHACVPTQAPIY